jgi:hypothetical protein
MTGSANRRIAWFAVKSLVPWCLALLLLVPALAAEKPPLPHARLGVANGCFVESVALLDDWQAATGPDGWSKLLRWGAKADEEVVAGHAVAVVEAKGRLWCWDVNFGWSPLTVDLAQRDTEAAVAAPIVARYTRIQAQYPNYLSDFPQTAGPMPDHSALLNGTDQNPSLAAVVAVAAKLGACRPVNIVTFNYGPEAARRPSAAVVFVFGGRYCVYIPEFGTVPTRAHGGVENLRLIHDLLRRICGGVWDLQKL